MGEELTPDEREVCAKAARRIGLTLTDLQLAAIEFWGHSRFDEEREALKAIRRRLVGMKEDFEDRATRAHVNREVSDDSATQAALADVVAAALRRLDRMEQSDEAVVERD